MLIVSTSSLYIYHVSKYHTVLINIVSVNYHHYHLLLLHNYNSLYGYRHRKSGKETYWYTSKLYRFSHFYGKKVTSDTFIIIINFYFVLSYEQASFTTHPYQ